MENDKLKVKVNGNGSIDVLYKETGKEYRNLNYLTSQGEIGNAWNHKAPEFDRKYNTMGNNAKIYVTESGELTGTVVCEYDFELPESCEVNPSSIYRKLPVKIAYTLDDGADFVKVKIELDNTIKDHWLRANFPTDIETDVSIADSHFDIVKRNIEIPDSKGWVEQAFGTHPLRTFVTVTDGENGLAVMPKGLFEYEVFDDKTIALTLIRACRIKLAVSEEKITELPDDGVQCPGRQEFEYAIQFHTGNYNELPNKAAEYFAPVKCAVCGRGKSELPRENSLIEIDNKTLHVTAVKRANDGNGIIVRMYNPAEEAQKFVLNVSREYSRIEINNMAEEFKAVADAENIIEPKKIMTYRIVF